ncbi:MAG: hypothetical protein LBU37_02160 [Tannerellaceae bacterium]|jgi:hypothetical protein|nr:hypothetical protein [Tannerellaceae bacterium]
MRNQLLCLLALFLSGACSHSPVKVDEELNQLPELFPDYTGCTIPPNIAPLNFALATAYDEAYAVFFCSDKEWEVKAGKEQFTFPVSEWRKFLQQSKGGAIHVKIMIKKDGKWTGYLPFQLSVAPEPVDPYIAYRLIEPGYELWNQMGIYQRNLENYAQSPIIENKMTDNNCMNCHSFCMQNPGKMLFHIRGSLGSTVLLDGDKAERLNTKTAQTMSALVYPSWHPGGRYIAFSVNDTKQAFHMNNRNRVEVYDYKSDVVVYDMEKHEIITTPSLFSEGRMETFPAFSPDGRTLYFCTADTCAMPDEFTEVKYSLCSIAFDPETRRFGTVADTLFHAEENGMSVSFPRVSPDGNYLMYTKAAYGNFSIWHKDADLWLIALASGKHFPLETANSKDVESYHSWSSNSRWVVFGSRRLDGLYTRLYIAYMDAGGQAGKPFLVPQKKASFYHDFMKSYNIPEFITGKVKEQGYRIGQTVKKEKGIDVSFAEIK